MLLAEGLSRLPAVDAAGRGPIAIKVATATPACDFDDLKLPFEVVREPGLLSLVKLVYEADVVQLSGACFVPLFLARILGKPVVIEHHGYNASCPNGLLFYEPTQSVCPGHFMDGRYGKCIECNAEKQDWLRSVWMLFWTFPRRWLCQRASANIPITQHVLNRLCLPRSKVIYYGIPDSPHSKHLTQILQPSTDVPCFAYLGRLVTLKGLLVLVEATRILNEQGYRFLVKFIGDGPERTVLESRVRKLRLQGHIEFTGFVGGDRLRSEMESVLAVIMPSIWEETAGLAAMEQMMRGRLVIVSDIGGLSEVVGDTGLKSATGNAASLADCMKHVIDRPGLAARFGSMARVRALSLFRQDRMIDMYLQVYQDLVEPKGTPTGILDPL